MTINPCKKNQDKAIEEVCKTLGGEYYGPSGKFVSITKSEVEMAFLEYDKNSEGLKEIDLTKKIGMYQAIVVVDSVSMTIKYPIKILINASVVNQSKFNLTSSKSYIEYDGELKVESIMEAIRILSSNVIGATYEQELDDLDYKDGLRESLEGARLPKWTSSIEKQ